MKEKRRIAYLIGAGPGDPELLTLKAVRAIESSQAILYDQLVNQEILQYASPGTEMVFVGKSKGRHIIPQEDINQLLVRLSKKYDCISRLKGGDPLIFGRGGEEMEVLLEHGVEVEVIPGITAASGAAAALGLPLTHRDYSSEVTFITGHKKMDGDYTAFQKIDLTNKTVVIYMGVTAMHEICRAICKGQESKNIPVAIIESATTKQQRVTRCVLGEIGKIAQKEEITPPALIIIGNVVNYLDRIERLKQVNINDTEKNRGES